MEFVGVVLKIILFLILFAFAVVVLLATIVFWPFIIIALAFRRH
jgi:hypothetical protein